MTMTAHEDRTTPPRAGLDASRGLQWWSGALTGLFGTTGQLGTWVLMALAYIVLSLMLHLIPVLGFVSSLPLNFVFSGGLLLAASRTARGAVPPFADLFAGFGARAGPLLSAGILVFLACMAVFLGMLMVGAWAVISAVVGGLLDTMTLPDPTAWGIGLGTAGALLLCLLALVPISMAAWLAPALIMMRGVAPVDALRMSLTACQRNLGALTVYGLVGILFAVAATLLLGLGWLVVVPLIYLSTFAAYEDIFGVAVEVLP